MITQLAPITKIIGCSIKIGCQSVKCIGNGCRFRICATRSIRISPRTLIPCGVSTVSGVVQNSCNCSHCGLLTIFERAVSIKLLINCTVIDGFHKVCTVVTGKGQLGRCCLAGFINAEYVFVAVSVMQLDFIRAISSGIAVGIFSNNCTGLTQLNAFG